jgi:DNA-binding NarL/FixJ family response regulator
MVKGKPIRVFLVDAAPEGGLVLAARLGEIEGIEVVGVAHSRNTAKAEAERLEPDVLLIDLMLPGYRSIDIVRQTAGEQPQIQILALAPADPTHDRIMLAVEAGALGYVCRDADLSEFRAAIEQVHQGEPWLPLHQTYEVLQNGASELAVSAQELRDRLGQVILGLIPLTGLVAAITAYLWREYWGAIGVRVADLGVDPTSRMIDMLVVLLVVIGIFGPLLFVRSWVEAIGTWIEKRPRLAAVAAKVNGLHVGGLPVSRILLTRWTAWMLLALLVVGTMLLLTVVMPLIMVLLIGPGVGLVLLASLLDLSDELPEGLHLPHLEPGQVIAFLGIVIIIFLLVLGIEVLILGPDLRADGLHGILAPAVLGFGARPVMLYDLDEKQEPLGALYLGGNADLYVLYDPCTEITRFVPVGSSRVEHIDKVTCRSP